MVGVVYCSGESGVCECFCFKQRTAYEMRISDWSSDVCSSDQTATFVVTVTLQVKKGAIGAFREAVLQQASTSLTKERGGRCFDVSFDTACPERMFPYEIYDDGDRKSTRLNSSH